MEDLEFKTCPYCGEKILAIAKKCKHCGEWLTDNIAENSVQKKDEANYVTIHGYDENFAVTPTISVYRDGVHLGEVGRHGLLKVKIDKDCSLKFSCAFRSASLFTKKGVDTHVLLSFDRFSGSLKAVKSSDSNLSSVAQKKEKDSTRSTMLSIVLIIILLIIWLIL